MLKLKDNHQKNGSIMYNFQINKIKIIKTNIRQKSNPKGNIDHKLTLKFPEGPWKSPRVYSLTL